MKNKLQITQDGSHTLMSDKFGVTYHSKYGAIQESMHVFITAGLRHRLTQISEEEKATNLSILEIGFGTGLNAYLTLLETINPPQNLTIKYTSLETSPISQETIDNLNYTEVLKQNDKALFQSIHDCDWNNFQQLAPNFQLKKVQTALQDFNPTEKYDLIFFDAFAPESQPELWEIPIFEKLFNAMESNAILTTYCAKGQVKRNLKAVGFAVEGIPGPPGKREMTRATRQTKL